MILPTDNSGVFMKRNKQLDYPLLGFFGIVFFFLYILQYTDGVFAKDGAFPQLMLPCVVFVAMFFGDGAGAVFGIVAGSFLDAITAGTVCYNSVILLLLGYTTGLAVEFFINNNFRSAVLVTLATTAVYYFGRWVSLGFNAEVFRERIASSWFLTVIYAVPIYLFIYLTVKFRKKQLLKNSNK